MERIKQALAEGRTALGIEFGSTRIKAVLVDEESHPIAQGGYDWENRYVDNIWSYTMEDIWKFPILWNRRRMTVMCRN